MSTDAHDLYSLRQPALLERTLTRNTDAPLRNGNLIHLLRIVRRPAQSAVDTGAAGES